MRRPFYVVLMMFRGFFQELKMKFICLVKLDSACHLNAFNL